MNLKIKFINSFSVYKSRQFLSYKYKSCKFQQELYNIHEIGCIRYVRTAASQRQEIRRKNTRFYHKNAVTPQGRGGEVDNQIPASKNEKYYYYFLFMNLKDESLSINTVREDIFIFSMFF